MTSGERWDRLAADLAAQAQAMEDQERAGEVAERLRHEVGQLLLVDRLRAAVGQHVSAMCAGPFATQGPLIRVASDALVIQEPARRECLLALAHMTSISGLSRLSATHDEARTRIDDRLGLRVMLRSFARDRSVVRVHLHDGTVLDGTFDRVGADFVELAAHAPGEARRRNAVRDVLVLSLAVVVAVRRDGA